MESGAPGRGSVIRVFVAYISGAVRCVHSPPNSTARKSQMEVLWSAAVIAVSVSSFFLWVWCIVFGLWMYWWDGQMMRVLVFVTDESPWSFKFSSFLKLMPIFSFLFFSFRFRGFWLGYLLFFLFLLFVALFRFLGSARSVCWAYETPHSSVEGGWKASCSICVLNLQIFWQSSR